MGIVQGVGYRPFVAGLAEELGITGSVCNSGGIVTIKAEGGGEAMDTFICRLRSSAPPAARITKIRVETVQDGEDQTRSGATGFHIRESESGSDADLPLLPADLPVCGECLKELCDPADRRYRYPFISCVSCGPRYSIMEKIPYDRGTVTMKVFDMCSACRQEYTGRGRRRHAQTISCKDCGPRLLFDRFPFKEGEMNQARPLSGDPALEECVHLLEQEGILVLKGTGGYQFACLAASAKAVSGLREWKMRDKKPFAVMFPDVTSVKAVCEVSEEEETLLCSPARPIVLLRCSADSIVCSQVSSQSRFLGAFLPGTGLHHILTGRCGPLVITSANISGEPILIRDEDVRKLKPPCMAGMAWHTRRIASGLDDSLARAAAGGTQLLRRSRGYVPLPCPLPVPAAEPVLAFGGDLKACFCLASGDRAYVSQYFGDMEDYSVLERYRESLSHMQQLFGIHPRYLVCDLHPGYVTGQMAQESADRLKCPLIRVQHHHAHIASVMAEHDLKECIGVAFDGTGYGTDGSIWGSEFLICRGAEYERGGSLSYNGLTGADSAAADARLSAICQLIQAGLADGEIALLYGETEQEGPAGNIGDRLKIVRAALNGGINTSRNSGMGRLFDAVSSILGICQVNSYEGECAVSLENAAAYAMEQGWEPWPLSFEIGRVGDMLLADRSGILRELSQAIAQDRSAARQSRLALGFHYALAGLILDLCSQLGRATGIRSVALGGGVFANLILLEESVKRLEREGFTVCVNRKVPMNDGCIAYGQAFIASQSLAIRPETV